MSALSVAALGAPAYAAPRTTVVYETDYILTRDIAVHDDTVYMAYCNNVHQFPIGEPAEPVQGGCGVHVAVNLGVAVATDGTVGRSFSTPVLSHGPNDNPQDSRVRLDRPDGRSVTADIDEVEYAANPDGSARYGFTSDTACARQAVGGDPRYNGRLSTDLPSIAAARNGRWYTTDRDGNTVYRVTAGGRVSVLAVLPPVTLRVTAAVAEQNGWPSCTVGLTYAYEPAPSEIEAAPDGWLYVAGRPTGATAGPAAQSLLYRVHATTGKVERLPQRFTGDVDLAVDRQGRVFVAQRAAERISVLSGRGARTYLRLPRVLAVETDERGRLYAAQRGEGYADPSLEPGRVLRVG